MSQEFDDAAKRFVQDKGDALRPLVKVIPNEEDQVWEEHARTHDIHERNKAAMGAWKAAGEYTTGNSDKLGRLTLRQAFEEGFMQGYKFAKEK